MHKLYTRLNTGLLVFIALTGVVIVTMLATRASGGPLDPPGAPAPTDGVRHDGTPISSLPFTITVPGSYYVTRNLTGAAGITISADFVTLDLQGFTLTGTGILGTFGIYVNGAHRDLEIRNGTIAGWGDGVGGANATYSRFEDLRANGNTGAGIAIGAHSVVQDCDASGNGTGIDAVSSVVRRCNVTDNTGTGIQAGDDSLIEDNNIRNDHVGLFVSGSRATIRLNEFSDSSPWDIRLSLAVDVVLRENVLTDAAHFSASNSGYRVLSNSCHSGPILPPGTNICN